MFNASVCWSAGHGKNSGSVGYRDPGMDSAFITDEAAVCQGMASRLSLDTAALGIYTLFRDTGKFSQADDDAVKYDAETFIELHLNSFNGKARGTEAWVDSVRDKADYRLAKYIVNAIAAFGFPNRGVKENGWAVVKEHPGMDATLVEMFFGDNKADVDLFNKNLDQIEKAILNAYLAHIGRKPVTTLPRKTVTGRSRLRRGTYLKVI